MDSHLEGALDTTLESYRATLVAVGHAGVRACPPAGEPLQQNLLALQERLTREAAPDLIADTKQQVEAQLETWGEHVARVNQEKTNEVKDILAIIARAAGEVGERDQRYTKSFGDLANRLQETTKLNDLTAIRQSLSKGVTDIKACVERMAKDGQDSVASLRAQLSTYKTRLEELERTASLDLLTGLFNRRKIETHLEGQIRDGRNFSVIYLDLNGFKQINDTLGHLAGDDLLKQFAGELRAGFCSTDTVGRWGGDEFAIGVVDGDYAEAKLRLDQIEKWVNGEYTLTTASVPQKVKLAVAAGLVTWKRGESIADASQRGCRYVFAEITDEVGPGTRPTELPGEITPSQRGCNAIPCLA